MYLHCLWRHGYLDVSLVVARFWTICLQALPKSRAQRLSVLVVINAVVAVWAAPAVSASISRKTRIHFALRHWDKRGAYRSIIYYSP